MEIRHNRLYCNRENDFELFFSITDYLNSFFTSNNPEDIIKFYSFFRDRDSLIKWMKDRPKGHYDIIEVEGNKDIIVVIPTADFNGKFAKACRDDIFKGLHMIFVQSGGKEDYYFNIAHNYNAGIKKAMEYNPKWIVLSNDDMYKIDDVDVLVKELSKLDPEKIDSVFTNESPYHSYYINIGQFRKYTSILIKIIKPVWKIKEKISRKYEIYFYGVFVKNKFLVNLLFKNLHRFIITSSFGIFSGNFIKKIRNNPLNNPLDETYISGYEDIDISLIINYNYKFNFINYKIGDYIGMSLGPWLGLSGVLRELRDMANLTYFNKKFYNYLNNKNRY